MNIVVEQSVWLNEAQLCSLDELMQASGLSQEELQEFIASGAIEPVEPVESGERAVVFRSSCIVIARTARRLRDDFELDTRGVAVALNLLRRIRELEAAMEDLRAKLPHRAG